MSTTPTKEQVEHARQAGDMMKDIATLLKSCVFPGELALRVAGAISWLERSAAAMPQKADEEAVEKAAKKRAKKALKLAKPAAPAAAEEAKKDG